jgi:anti-sigma B factor antagonist
VTRTKSGKPKRDVARLALDGELTIARAAELKSQLVPPLAQGGALEIDLSKVTELDTAGVQLLLLAQRTAAANDVELRFVGHSRVVANVVALLGLGTLLGLNAPSSVAGGSA